MLPVALEISPRGIEMVSVCAGLLGEEGRVDKKTINRVPLYISIVGDRPQYHVVIPVGCSSCIKPL